MKIRTKILLIIAAVTLLYFAFYVSVKYAQNYFYSVSKQNIAYQEKQKLYSFVRSLNKPFTLFVSDKRSWDTALSAEQSFPKNQELKRSMIQYGISVVWAYNKSFNLMYSNNNISDNILFPKIFSHEKIKHLLATRAFCSFFIKTDAGIMQIKGRVVSSENDSGGYFFAGKLWGKAWLHELQEMMKGSLNIISVEELSRKSTYDEVFPVYYPMKGIDGEPIGFLKFSTSHDLIETFSDFIKHDIGITTFFIFILTILVLVLVSYMIVFPMHKLIDSLRSEESSGVENLLKRNDEFGDLARLIVRFFTTKQELKEAKEISEESVKVKNQFLANINHELRSPLNGIKGVSDLLKDTELDETQKKYVEMLNYSADNLIALISDLLSFTRMQDPTYNLRIMPFDLTAMLDNIQFILTTESKHKKLEQRWNVNLPFHYYVKGDRLRVEQIIMNLISNAIKYTDLGFVSLTVAETRRVNDIVTVTFSVADSGRGIPEDKLDTIFDSFKQLGTSYTKKHAGVGLGLAIVKELTKLMGGELSVKSELGKGSEFTVTLPFQTALANEIEFEQNEDLKNKKYADLSILIAEDDHINALVFSTMLKKEGMLCDVATNGLEAVDMAKHNAYDIILMDVGMPVVDGIEAAKDIRQLEKETGNRATIIALTAHAFLLDKEKCIEAGMDDYLYKPVNRSLLVRTIEKHLE